MKDNWPQNIPKLGHEKGPSFAKRAIGEGFKFKPSVMSGVLRGEGTPLPDTKEELVKLIQQILDRNSE